MRALVSCCGVVQRTHRARSLGLSYERSVLMEHLKHNPIDPLTRVPLDAEALYPNTALRSAIQQFLLE